MKSLNKQYLEIYGSLLQEEDDLYFKERFQEEEQRSRLKEDSEIQIRQPSTPFFSGLINFN